MCAVHFQAVHRNAEVAAKCHSEGADNVLSTGQRPKDLPETLFHVRRWTQEIPDTPLQAMSRWPADLPLHSAPFRMTGIRRALARWTGTHRDLSPSNQLGLPHVAPLRRGHRVLE